MTRANLILLNDSFGRWKLNKRMVKKEGYYPATNYINPPIGSNPFGIQGYKKISSELILDINDIPNYILVPCARGDLEKL